MALSDAQRGNSPTKWVVKTPVTAMPGVTSVELAKFLAFRYP
jgi:hypothetical protein